MVWLRFPPSRWSVSGYEAPSRSSPSRSPAAALLPRSEEHTSELQSPCNLVCRLLLEKKKKFQHMRYQLRNHSPSFHPTRNPRQHSFLFHRSQSCTTPCVRARLERLARISSGLSLVRR